MRHVGARPARLPLVVDERCKRKRKTYFEVLDDGSYRLWNNRLLNSGCGRVVTEIVEDGNLIYCPTCRAWFNNEQFVIEDEG